MKNKSPHLSVIIPVYNETHRLKNLYKISEFLRKQSFSTELIVIDDGSNDQSKKIVKKITTEIQCILISYSKNQGKGYAVKKGMLSARGKKRIFVDVDLSTPIEESKKFLVGTDTNHILIGSRKIKGAKLLIRQPKTREFMGKFFTYLSQKVLGLTVSDFTCGMKSFDEKAAIAIFSKVTIDRWGFDPEILFIANKLGFGIKEIPVTWQHDSHTRVKFPQDIFTSFIDLFKIQINNITGKYS